jgi:hypothetical protein
MRLRLIAAALPMLLACNAAAAQVSAMVTPTPAIGATSPLGSMSGSSVSPTGIPLGATEITSAGTSPVPSNPTGTIAMPSSAAACSTLGTSSSQMFGSSATFDGGGTSASSSMPATASMAGNTALSPDMSSGTLPSSGLSTPSGMTDTAGMSGMCGSGSNSAVASSTPTSPTVVGGVNRTGIPLGSTEISNLGVSSAAAVPTLGVAATPSTITPTIPVVPTVIAPPAATSSSTTVPGDVSGITDLVPGLATTGLPGG